MSNFIYIYIYIYVLTMHNNIKKKYKKFNQLFKILF